MILALLNLPRLTFDRHLPVPPVCATCLYHLLLPHSGQNNACERPATKPSLVGIGLKYLHQPGRTPVREQTMMAS